MIAVHSLLALTLALLILPRESRAQSDDPDADLIRAGGESGSSAFVIARVKYEGGGDWYNDPTSEINMLTYLREQTGMNVRPTFEYVDIASDNIFRYPVIFITGHGNISFTDAESKRLRTYLDKGGFLYLDDDYGLDTAIRREMRKVIPDQEFRELPFDHPIYHCFFDFPHGLPKIHEHNNKPPQGFGLFVDNRLAVYYTYETNPSDGWADPDVHHDTPERREQAFRIGTNILVYALTR